MSTSPEKKEELLKRLKEKGFTDPSREEKSKPLIERVEEALRAKDIANTAEMSVIVNELKKKFSA